MAIFFQLVACPLEADSENRFCHTKPQSLFLFFSVIIHNHHVASYKHQDTRHEIEAKVLNVFPWWLNYPAMLAGLLYPGHFLGCTLSEQWCREGCGSAAKKLQHLPANLSSYLGYGWMGSQFPIPVRLWWPISHPRGEQRCLMLGLSSGVVLKLRFDCHIIDHETYSFVVSEIIFYV